MITTQNGQFIVKQLIQVAEKEAIYLERTTTRFRGLNIDISWVESFENSDEYSEMLDAPLTTRCSGLPSNACITIGAG